MYKLLYHVNNQVEIFCYTGKAVVLYDKGRNKKHH